MTRDDRGLAPRRALLAAFTIVAILAAWPAVAAAQTCGADAEARSVAIRRFLDREARRARRWDLAWGIGYGVATAGQVALIAAEWHPLEDFDDDVEASLYVGAGKSAIGSAVHFVLPLEIVRPAAPTGDACADLATAERALRESASNEKKAFFLNHLGGFALNVGGMLVLGLGYDTWKEGVVSAATGYPIAMVTTYTMPRASWKAVRRGVGSSASAVDIRLTPVGGGAFTGLVVSGSF